MWQHCLLIAIAHIPGIWKRLTPVDKKEIQSENDYYYNALEGMLIQPKKITTLSVWHLLKKAMLPAILY